MSSTIDRVVVPPPEILMLLLLKVQVAEGGRPAQPMDNVSVKLDAISIVSCKVVWSPRCSETCDGVTVIV